MKWTVAGLKTNDNDDGDNNNHNNYDALLVIVLCSFSAVLVCQHICRIFIL
jgi:hypothetical protein